MDWLDFEGRRVEILPGDTVAAAAFRAGIRVFSRSLKYHRPRGLYCLTGDCPNCLLTIDGETGARSCVTEARHGMRARRPRGWPSADRDVLSLLGLARPVLPVGFYYKTLARPRWLWPRVEPAIRRLAGLGPVAGNGPPAEREVLHHHPDLLVVGAGPAGLAAALTAGETGQRVLLVDEGAVAEKVSSEQTRAAIAELLELVRLNRNITLLERATAIGVYEGPLVPVNAADKLHLVRPHRVIVATGAVERHAVFPGNDLPGVWLGRGAARLAVRHRVAPGRRAVVVAGTREASEHVQALQTAGVEVAAVLLLGEVAGEFPGVRAVPGRVLAARGRGSLRAVVAEVAAARERIACDALVLACGLVPRDGLLRQAAGLPVVGAGEVIRPDCTVAEALESGRLAAAEVERAGTPPARDVPSPADGVVCLCEDVETRDLARAWEEGFRSPELLKRYTTATMGPCQGAICQAPLLAFVGSSARDSVCVTPTTARPPARPIKLEDAAAGRRFAPEQRTTLHQRHLELGAVMERLGGWRRPESYGDPTAEYWAVRRAVSAMDVGTLGKILVAGRDATAFLERLYPCRIADLEPGQLRYSLLLNEAGHVIDDGIICALGKDSFYLTCTTGGAEAFEAWLRDWAETWGLRVHLADETAARGAINVAGPRARELLSRLAEGAVDGESFPYGRARRLTVAGVPCLVLRLGFVGELSFELHHPSSRSVPLWDALLEAGADLGIIPHGLEALRTLRLEKGHILVGQDTDFDSTPDKLGLGWAISLEKDAFVGWRELRRLQGVEVQQRLVRIAFAEIAPAEGASLFADGQHVGHLTSSRFSPVLGHGVALGWLRRSNDGFPTRVRSEDGKEGKVVTRAFYDPEGLRARA